MNKHTPAPWTIEINQIRAGLKTEGRPGGINTVGMVNFGGLGEPGGNPEANARLIAAAPEMLEALESLANNCDEDGTCFCEIGEGYHALSCPIIISKIARAAIAKATGK